MSDENATIHAEITVSAIRRITAYGVLLALGAVLVYTAFAGQVGFSGGAILLGLGVTVLWCAETLRRATRSAIQLTDQGLFDTQGTQLAALDDIASVNRGAFALKPSNGFSLVMKTKQPGAWVPGVWWRFGRRVGVGGVTAAGASKFMAEQIALRLVEKPD